MNTQISDRPATAMSHRPEHDPFRALQERMEELIGSFSREWDGGWLTGAHRPPVDVSETDEAIQVHVDLPGIKPEDVTVEVRGNALHISGERRDEREEKDRTWHRTECRVGRFSRSMTPTCEVQDDRVEAEFTEGVSNICLPRAETAKSHRIPVKAK